MDEREKAQLIVSLRHLFLEHLQTRSGNKARNEAALIRDGIALAVAVLVENGLIDRTQQNYILAC